MTDFEEIKKAIQRINLKEQAIKMELQKIEKNKMEIVLMLAQSIVEEVSDE